LPTFLLQWPRPLLFSRPFDVSNSWAVEGGALSITSDHRLTLWTRPDRGAQELKTGLPPGTVHWCSRPAFPMTSAVIGRLGKNGLHYLSVDIEQLKVSIVPLRLDADTPRAAFSHGGYVFVVFDDHLGVVDQRGEWLCFWPLKDWKWRWGRYF